MYADVAIEWKGWLLLTAPRPVSAAGPWGSVASGAKRRHRAKARDRAAAMTGLALPSPSPYGGSAALASRWTMERMQAAAQQTRCYALWLVRGMALAMLCVRAGALYGWRRGVKAGLGLISPSWPVVALAWSASATSFAQVALAELLLLAGTAALPLLGLSLRRSLRRVELAVWREPELGPRWRRHCGPRPACVHAVALTAYGKFHGAVAARRGATSNVAERIRRRCWSGTVGHGRVDAARRGRAPGGPTRSRRRRAVRNRRAVGFDDGPGRMAAPLGFRVRSLGRPPPWRGLRILHVARNEQRHAGGAARTGLAMARALGDGESAAQSASPRRETRSRALVSPASFNAGMRGIRDARPDAAGPRSFLATATCRVRPVRQRRAPVPAAEPTGDRGTCRRTGARLALRGCASCVRR